MERYEVPLEWYVLLACTLLAISLDFLFRDAPAPTRKRIGRTTILLTLLLAFRVAITVPAGQPTAVLPPASSSAPTPTEVARSPEPSPSPTSAPPQPIPSGQLSPRASAPPTIVPRAPGAAALPECPIPTYGGILEESSEFTARQLASPVSSPMAGCVKAISHWAQYAAAPHLEKPCYLWFTSRSVALPAGEFGSIWQIPPSDIDWFTSKFRAQGDNARCTVVTL